MEVGINRVRINRSRPVYLKTSAHCSCSFNGTAKTKLPILVFWYCGQFVKNPIDAQNIINNRKTSVNVVDLVKTLWSVSSIHKRCDYF